MLQTQDSAVDVVRRNLHAVQHADHHHTRRLFITVPGVERGEVQIFASGSQAIRQVLLNRIRCARRYGKADATRNDGQRLLRGLVISVRYRQHRLQPLVWHHVVIVLCAGLCRTYGCPAELLVGQFEVRHAFPTTQACCWNAQSRRGLKVTC